MSFCPRHVKDIAAEVPESRDWLVQDLLPKGTLALLAAYPKVGKSTLVSQLAVAVCQGRDFLGRSAKQGGVLYVVAEEKEADVIDRLKQLGMQSEIDPIWLWSKTISDDQTTRDAMEKFIKEKNVELVIIDTFAAYLMIKDETNNSLVTERLKPYVDMAHNTPVTILFVHHERKNNDGNDDSRAIRGGSAIFGLTDLAFQLQRETGAGTGRRLKISGRYQEIPKSLKLDYAEDKYVSLGTPEELERSARREKVMAVLPNTPPGFTVDDIATKTGLKEKAARQALDDAEGLKLVNQSGSGKKGDPHRYWRNSVGQSSSVTTSVPIAPEERACEPGEPEAVLSHSEAAYVG